LGAIDAAAERLGNTRAVVRDSYMHPVVPESYASGELHETWRSKRAGKRLDRAERVVTALLDG
jgi:DNA topoisomerase-1